MRKCGIDAPKPGEPSARVVISPRGEITFVWDDRLEPLLPLGEVSIRRASWVEPRGTAWIADLSPVGGPTLGPFRLRHQALAAERAWLEEEGVPFPGAQGV